MNDINLLPKEDKKVWNPRHFFMMIVPLAVLLICFILYYGIIRPLEQKKEYLRVFAKLESESDRIMINEADLETLSVELDELSGRFSGFDELDQGTPGQWQKILKVLIDSLPYNTKINGILCDNNTIYISGSSPTDLISSAYLLSLKKSNMFEAVSIERINYSNDNTGVTFQLYCFLSQKQEVENE